MPNLNAPPYDRVPDQSPTNKTNYVPINASGQTMQSARSDYGQLSKTPSVGNADYTQIIPSTSGGGSSAGYVTIASSVDEFV